jgi:hypothetical protein
VNSAWSTATAGLATPVVSTPALAAAAAAAATTVVYITVEGAIDKLGTARAIRDLLNTEARFAGRVAINGEAL